MDARYHPGVSLGLGILGIAGLYAVWTYRQKLGHEREFNARRDNLVAEGDPRFPLIGKVLGGYLLVDKLGAGGFASVYRGLSHESLNEKEAAQDPLPGHGIGGRSAHANSRRRADHGRDPAPAGPRHQRAFVCS